MSIDPDSLAVGDALPPLTIRLTRTHLVRYAGASGDFNPIHHSDYFAERVGLPGVIAHGLLTMGSALRVVTDWVGDPGQVSTYFVRFVKPVVVPDDADGAEVQIAATVASIDGHRIGVSIEATYDGQKVLGAARAEVDLDR